MQRMARMEVVLCNKKGLVKGGFLVRQFAKEKNIVWEIIRNNNQAVLSASMQHIAKTETFIFCYKIGSVKDSFLIQFAKKMFTGNTSTILIKQRYAKTSFVVKVYCGLPADQGVGSTGCT